MKQMVIKQCSRVKKKEEIQQRLLSQQGQIQILKQSLSRVTGISLPKPKSLERQTNKNSSQSLSSQNKKLRLQLSMMEEKIKQPTNELDSFQQKIMLMFDQSRQENKVAIIELLNYVCNKEQVLTRLHSSINEIKDIFMQFNGLIKEGPIQPNYLDNSITHLKNTFEDFFNLFNNQIAQQQFRELKEMIKVCKAQLFSHINQQYGKYLQRKQQKDLTLIEKERQMISCLPKELKQMKQLCRQREDHYKRQKQLLEKHLKQTQQQHQRAINIYEAYIAELTSKYKTFMETYNRQFQQPIQQIRVFIANEVQIVHQQINKITKNCDIQTIVSKLSQSVNKYIQFKSNSDQPSIEKFTKTIGTTLDKIHQENFKDMKTLLEMYEMGEADYKEYCLKTGEQVQKLQEQVDQQRKKNNELQLENKINCQKQYILILEQYNSKLESCIKRIGTKTNIQEEWKIRLSQINKRHDELTLQYEALRNENQKLILQVMTTKQLLKAKNKRSEEIYQLLKQLMASTNQIKDVKAEISRYFEDQLTFQREIHQQANTFNSAFVQPHTKMIQLKEKLPHIQSNFQNMQASLDISIGNCRLQQYENIKKEYEAFFKSKRVVQTRIDRGINEILKLHSEYLKVAVEKDKEQQIKIDDKILKSMSSKIILKMQDFLGGFKVLRESLIKVVYDLRKEFEVSQKQMKTLMVYIKGSKLERSVIDLTKTLNLNYQKLKHFNNLIFSLLDSSSKKPSTSSTDRPI